jgi:hypothetical protein
VNVSRVTPHTPGVPPPPQKSLPLQLPQLLTVREVPQLSVAVHPLQFLPIRVQKAALVSGTQAQTLVAPQVCGAVHSPHWGTVRVVPQLSAPVTWPQFFPSREQKVVSVSGVQLPTLDAPQLWGAELTPQLAAVRALPQLSVPLTAPHVFPRRAQKVTSVSATHARHWPLAPQVWVPVHPPQLTVREAPQLSAPVYGPHTRPTRAQSAASVSGVQPAQVPVAPQVWPLAQDTHADPPLPQVPAPCVANGTQTSPAQQPLAQLLAPHAVTGG